MWVVRCDGSPVEVDALTDALAAALDGGPPVLPYDGPSPDLGSTEPPEGAALLIETSGSTGGAKRVVLSAAALRASATATHQRLGGPGRWLLALPAHHVAGAQVIVRGLLAGHRPTLLDNRAGFRVERFAEVAGALLASTDSERYYLSLVPTQLHRVLAEDLNNEDVDNPALGALRGFHAVLVGGAATPDTLLRRARAAGVRVVTTYGMSETAGGCVYDGVPLDGVRVRLDGGGAGRIELSGPTLATGYLGRPELTAESFTGGWFRTTDLGRLESDGTLRVLGRADDVITTGGESVHPAAVERVLTAQSGVRGACVVGLADPEWGQLVAAALVVDGSADPDGLGDAVRAALGAPSVPRLMRVLDELPLRGIGKPDRTEVARLLAASSLGHWTQR
jgi:O-succinylbenzoic acid--CoA ligase